MMDWEVEVERAVSQEEAREDPSPGLSPGPLLGPSLRSGRGSGWISDCRLRIADWGESVLDWVLLDPSPGPSLRSGRSSGRGSG